MELTLNLVWVFVALAGVLVQIVTLSRTTRSSHDKASPTRKMVAMGCALVILFFVISMTDDLHDQVLVWEESKHSRISAGSKNFACAASDRLISVGFLGFIPPILWSPPRLEWSRLAAGRAFHGRATVVRGSLLGRAPPTSLL